MCQVLNISEFWLLQNCQNAKFLNFQCYTGITYFRNYGWVLNRRQDAIMEGSEYSRIRNMVTQGSKNVWIWLKNVWINYPDYRRVLKML